MVEIFDSLKAQVFSYLKKNNFKQSGIKRQKYPYPENCITQAQRKRYRSILDIFYFHKTFYYLFSLLYLFYSCY